MFATILKNDVFANLAFILVLVVGSLSYMEMPRQQDPEINFNFIQVITTMPGASPEDIERRITEPLEDAIQQVTDLNFVLSQSREGLSLILVRFDEISDKEFDKRIADIRREVQNKEAQLPEASNTPFVYDVTTSNGFPTATLLLTGPAYDERFRQYATRISKDITRFSEVDRVVMSGFSEPELQVNFIPEKLAALGLNPSDISNALASTFRDSSAGDITVGQQNWLVRLQGVYNDPQRLANTIIKTPNGEVTLASIANVERGRKQASELVSYKGQPAILFSISKTPNINTLRMVEKIKTYIDERNQFVDKVGSTILLVDDQTEATRSALNVMQGNALLGLLMVLLVTYIFLGFKIALLTSVAIPFILAGAFWVLNIQGQSLNVMVLLGVIIALGMLVDDAVVVVESIYYRLERGVDALTASIEGIKEVIAPVTASVLTTIAAFLPLILLPGILGQFLSVVPIVVTIALLISLIEAYWMLPAHIIGFKIKLDNNDRMQKKRQLFLRKLRHNYSVILINALRYPLRVVAIALCCFLLAVSFIALGLIKPDFFASEDIRIFYVNVEMPPGTPLESTLETTEKIEQLVRQNVEAKELRSVVSTAGQQLTSTSPLSGSVFGQVTVSLAPGEDDHASVEEVIQSIEKDINTVSGPLNISFLRLSSGPPTGSPIELKIQGSDIQEIRRAAGLMVEKLPSVKGVRDIKTDDSVGQKVLLLELNHNAIIQAGLTNDLVRRSLSLLVDGEIVSAFQDQGEEVTLRVKASKRSTFNINEVLAHSLINPSGEEIPLSLMVNAKYQDGPIEIVHYNFLRTITVTADIDSSITDTKTANDSVYALWKEANKDFPTVQLLRTGLLDDIEESLGNILTLFVFGVLLMYLIIATQFRSYFQPFIILFTVCLAFIGVVFGLTVSRIPFSLYTMYGGVALAGMSVNAAIVLVSAANDRQKKGMRPLHAIIYAGRRRVVPILITSLTTIAGLASLAMGLGGSSPIWGPIATVIVWGLAFSTALTLFVIPGLYLGFERIKAKLQFKDSAITNKGSV